MEKQKLIYVESKALFSPSSVSNKAIVFIKDTKEIWTHGTYFICSNIWATPITLTLSGDSTGSVSIDGSGNVTLLVTNNFLTGKGSYSEANNAVEKSSYKLSYYPVFLNGSSNLFPSVNNANAILTLNTHDYTYNHQLGFSSNRGIYHRTRNAGTWETSWREILTSTNYTNYPHTFASLTNKPTTLSGYGITDCIPIISGGTVTTDTDLSTLGMTTSGVKFSISCTTTAYPFGLHAYSNFLMFRAASDTYSGIATDAFNGYATFIGGRNTETGKNNVPNWWFKIKGASETTYDLNSFLNVVNNSKNYVTINTDQAITSYKIFKATAPEDDREAVYYNIGLKLTSFGDNHKKVAAIGMGNEPQKWYKAAIGFERTETYDRGDIVLLFNNIPDQTTCAYSDIKVRINAAGNINTLGTVSASGFKKTDSSDSYVLLGGGGHKLLSDLNTSHTHSYLPLSGGTMTGTLTLKGSVFTDAANTGALNANNSNIYGLNSLYFADPSETAAEGINFYRSSTTVDSLWGSNGNLFWTPNRTYGLAGTNYYVLTSNNYTTYTIPYNKGNKSTGKVPLIYNDTLYNHESISCQYFFPPDNLGHLSYLLIAELSEYGTGVNTSYIDYVLSGSIYAYRGGNTSHSNSYNITIVVSVGPGTYSKIYTSSIKDAVIPMVVKYNSKYYIALKKNLGSSTNLYFIGIAKNLLSSYIGVTDESLIEFIKGPENTTSTHLYYYNAGTPKKYLHEGNYSNYALPLSGGTLTGTLTSSNIVPRTSVTYNIGTTSAYYNNIYALYFRRKDSSDSYVLLGGGGHKLLSELSIGSADKLNTTRYFWGRGFNGTLDVNGQINIVRNSEFASYNEGIRILASSAEWAGIFLGTDGTDKGYITSLWNISKTNSDSLRISRGATSNYLLDIISNGNIGIGTTSPSEKLEVSGNAIIGNSSSNHSLTIKSKMSGGVATLYFDNGVYSTDLPWKGYIAVSGWGDESMRVGTGLNGNLQCVHGMIFKLPRDIWGYSFRNNSNNDIAYLSYLGKLTTKLGYVVENGTTSQFLKADGSLDSSNYYKIGTELPIYRSVHVRDQSTNSAIFGVVNSGSDLVGGSDLTTVYSGTTNLPYLLRTSADNLYHYNANKSSRYLILDTNNYSSYALPLSGGTMTGALNFANNTWNKVGDDAYMGDCNVGGMLGIKSVNRDTPGFAMYNSGGTLLGKLYASGTSLYWSNAKILAASGTSTLFVMGDGSLYSDTVSYTTWDKTTTSGIAWFPIASIINPVLGSALFIVRAYAHSSIIFTVTSGHSTGNINVLAGGGDYNAGFAYIMGVRLIGDFVELGLNAAATNVNIVVKVLLPTFTHCLKSSLVESTSTTTPYAQYELNTKGNNFNFGIVSSKFTGNLIGNADTASNISTVNPILALPFEKNTIQIVSNPLGALAELLGTAAAITHALRFNWYDTAYEIGNVRGGASNSLGFGITYGNNNLCLLVKTNGTYSPYGFIGSLSGNASTASKWKDARTITLTGDVTGSVTLDGSSNVTLTTTTSGTGTTSFLKCPDKRNSYPAQIVTAGETIGASFMTASKLGISGDGSYYDALIIRGYRDSTGGNENAIMFGKNTSSVYHSLYAFGSTTTWGTLYKFLDSGNYKNYAPSLSGEGASGTWGINISGTANKVANALTLLLNGGTTSGTNKFVYDGTSAYTINITPASIGAAASSHNHDNTYLKLTGGTLGSSSASVTELRTLSSTAALRIMSYSDSTNYILSGNSSFDGNATLRITGYSNVTGTNLYFKFSNIYCRENDYINIDSGNYGSYALPLSGGTMTGTINCKAIVPITDNGYSIGTSSKTLYEIHANFFKRRGSSNDYVLLGGGEHKLISDFVLNYTAVVPGGSVGNNDSWTLILNNNYSTGWYNPCTMFYIRSHNFGCGILCFYHYWNTEYTSGYYDNSVWFFGAEHSAYSGTMGGTGRDINNFLKVYIDKDNDNLKIYYNRYNNLGILILELLFSLYLAGTLYPKGLIRASHFITNGAVTDLPTTSDTFVNIPIQTAKNHTEDIKTTRSVYASAFYENSDIRLKENVHSIDLIDLLKNVDLVQFNFKNDLNKKYGVIAQQLEQVGLNNLVYEHNGNKAVDYISLLVLETLRLRNEIKELKEKLDKKELSS